MKFKVNKRHITKGKIIYDAGEGCFDSTILMNTDIDILIAYLNVGIDSTDMEVKSIWGYNPEQQWIAKNLSIPYAEEGSLLLLDDYEAGLSYRLDRDKVWKSYIDKNTMWFCIGNTNIDRNDMPVKINENTIVVINELGELRAIFIHLI